jgi:hypothetical protein
MSDAFKKDAQELLFRNLEKHWRRRAEKFKKVGSPHAAAVLLDAVRDLQKAIDRFNAMRALDILKERIMGSEQAGR